MQNMNKIRNRFQELCQESECTQGMYDRSVGALPDPGCALKSYMGKPHPPIHKYMLGFLYNIIFALVFQANKHLIERRRRARINSSLTQLKTLVLEGMRKDVSMSRATSTARSSLIQNTAIFPGLHPKSHQFRN